MKEKEKKDFTLIEGNILESPIFILNHKDTRKEVEYQWKYKNELGKIVEEKLSIKAPLGIPTSFDMDVLNTIMEIYNYQKGTEKYGKNEVHFTDYSIAKKLQISFSGERLKRIKESYNRMVHTTLTYEKSFLEEKEKITRIVHLLSNVEYYEKKKGNREISITKVILDDILINSIERKYFKLIDFDKYISLPSGLPRRLYEYLEKKKYQKNFFEIGIKKLAQRIPLKTDRIDKLKKYLDNANKKLQEQRIIDKWVYTKSDNIIYYFTKSSKFKEIEKDLFYLENLVRVFYESIGSKKISTTQINDGQVVLQNLLDEGYTQEEIEYSLKWIVDNIPDTYSIGILPKVIGQALGNKESQEKIEEINKVQEQETKQKEEEIKREIEKEKKLDEIFVDLPKEKQEKIEEIARKNLIDQGINSNFISTMLIKVERNKILEKKFKFKIT